MFIEKVIGSNIRLRTRIVAGFGFGVLLFLPLMAILLDEPFFIDISSRILIYGLVAVSLDLILGYGGMVSFGHGAFFGLGAYVVGILSHHSYEATVIGFLPGNWEGTTQAVIQWPLAMIVSGILALLIGALSLRTSGVYFIMITLAFAQMLYFLMISIPTYGGEDGLNIWERSEIPLLDLYDSKTFYYTCLVLLLLCLWGCKRLVNSRFGMVLQGCRQNEVRMKALGYPVYRYKLTAFVISGMIAGLAGALSANHTEFVGPGLMHWTRSGEIMVMVILGGMGSLFGAVIGSASLLMMEEVLSGLTEHWMIFLGPILVLVVLFARKGLYGLLIGKGAGNG